MDEVMDVFDHWDGSYIARPSSPALTCDCSSCPSSSNSGWVSTGPLKNCKASCDVAVQGECLCTKKYHATGCTLQNCAADDNNLPASSYTCYCTPEFKPAGCVTRSNSLNPNCTSGVNYQDGCQCTETIHPDGCNIRLCNPDENSEGGVVCICGKTCDRRLHGCIKEPKL
ncbi:unnamed protein product [Orchesella dallaii]|uniref:EGF-like domain-containing protein n=1 Tax=Orchesella dallaii TaxID=48710 RepID=A0ABP1RGT3_9HEXA